MRQLAYTFKNIKPLYIELYEFIKNDITNDILKINEKLPSKRSLANSLNISTNTVVKAYDLLLDEGYIRSLEKKGYFVDSYAIKEKKITFSNLDIKKEKYDYDLTTSNIDVKNYPYKDIKKCYLLNLDSTNLNSTDTLLKEQIVKHLYENKNIKVNINQIFFFSGIDQILPLIFKLIDCKSIYIEDPGYKKIETISTFFNIEVKKGSIDDHGLIVPIYKEELIFTTPYSQFPLGKKMSINRKNEFVKYLNKTNAYLIEDSFDSDFKTVNIITPSLFSLSENVFYIESFSRTVSPNLRLSFVLIPQKLTEKFSKIKSIFSESVSLNDKLMLKSFIENGYYLKHINKTRILYRKKRDIILDILNKNNILILSKENYQSIIIKIKNEEKLKLRFKEENIKINFLSDYSDKYKDMLIIGYSSLDIDKIDLVINKLVKIIKDES